MTTGHLALFRHPEPPTVAAAIAALGPGSYLATDADNTLWAGDVGDEVVRRASSPPYHPWRQGDADFDWYQHEMERDYPRACQYAAEVLLRTDADAATPAVRSAIAARVQARLWLVEALQQAVQRGVHVWLVSASPRLSVEIGARLFGLEGCPILAVDCLAVDPPRFALPVPIGQGKVDAWRALQLPMPELALGDSSWDLPLLESARVGLLLTRACDDPTCGQRLVQVLEPQAQVLDPLPEAL